MNVVKTIPVLLWIAFLTLQPVNLPAQEPADREIILNMVQSFFDGMETRDVALSKDLLMPDGQYYGYRQEEDGVQVIRRSHAEHLDGLATRESELVERFWDPTVLLHDRMAVVWTPYDLYADGEFVHCGIDSFSFIKTNDGWKITGIVFSMEPDGCEESPLGPLARTIHELPR